jgi:RNA polymerase sigma-70 factor (ECF subfamily)
VALQLETATDPDPELALVRAQHQLAFRAAFDKAMRALTPRERALLRLTTVEGLTLAQVGQKYGKDGPTASRWLNAARLTLRTTTRQTLTQTLKLSSAELKGVLRVADSELQVNLVHMLTRS